MLPKGWAKTGRQPHETAADEAREEAGWIGEVEAVAIGHYSYRKRLHAFASVICDVDVYALEVRKQLDKWPEKGQRRLAFFTPEAAATLVQESELAALLRSVAGPGCGIEGPNTARH